MIYPIITAGMTFFVILVSILIGHLTASRLCPEYFCTIIPIVIAEILLGGSLIIVSISKKRNQILTAGLPAVAGCYLIFTFLMIIPYAAGLLVIPLLIIHIIFMLLTAILMGTFGMAVGHSNQTQASFANKKLFIMEVERFKAEYPDLISASEELKKNITALADALRYASDSVKGAEQADDKLANAIEQLHDAAASGNLDSCINAAAQAIRLNSWRQTVIKEMR